MSSRIREDRPPMAEKTLLATRTRREETAEVIHGVSVADPYRWLEDGESEETREWTAEQNAHTEALLRALPGRAGLEARLRELFSVGVVSGPAIRGQRFFYIKREGEQAQ